MKPINQIDFSSITPYEAAVEVEERKVLIIRMVGSLYPSILWDEIYKIRELIPASRNIGLEEYRRARDVAQQTAKEKP